MITRTGLIPHFPSFKSRASVGNPSCHSSKDVSKDTINADKSPRKMQKAKSFGHGRGKSVPRIGNIQVRILDIIILIV